MKKSNLLIAFTSLGITLLGISVLLIYNGSTKAPAKYNKAFNNYLSAYTSGAISRRSPIIVRFQDAVIPESQIGKKLKNNPFTFKPGIVGKAMWADTRTVEFVPDQFLPHNQKYSATIKLGSIVPNIPDSLQNFSFQFRSKKQHFKMSLGLLKPTNQQAMTLHKITNKITTNDYIAPEDLEKIVTAKIDNTKLKVTWKHISETEHEFSVDSIQRTAEVRELLFSWNANTIGVKQQGEKSIDIPALGNFSLLSSNSFNDDGQYVLLVFSDPIKKNQILDGIIDVPGYDITSFVDGNRIKIYPKKMFGTNITIKVDKNLENIKGHKLTNGTTSYLSFEIPQPSLKLVGKGTIIPQSKSLPFVFDAVSLNAVDVRVIKIHEKNVPQFLQVNYLNGSRELRRVGEVVLRKKVSLQYNKDINLSNWNRHVIDLAELVNTEPGAIYEVSLGFRRSYSIYPCSGKPQDTYNMLSLDSDWDSGDEEESSYWDGSEQLYSWEQSTDPCEESYYHSDQVASRNVLGSNIGLIAKGADGKYLIAATDLQTTQPLSGVTIEFYNYQQRKIESATTDERGFARLKSKAQPYLVLAKYGKQRGYLKLDQNNALSLSRFDISGKKYKKGVKGFIYTERGVWRPGDDIFVNFILEDKDQGLPANHPINLEFFDPQDKLIYSKTATTSVNGFYSFPLSTKDNDPTGNYWVKIKVGGSTFEKKLKIETIVPNRLKIELAYPTETLDKSTADLKGDLKVTWLHGAIGANLKADVSVSLHQVPTKFNVFNNYVFDDPTRTYYSEDKRIFDGVLDDNGQAKIPAKIMVDNVSAGMLKANFKTKVFEPGGNFSTDRFQMTFHPYETYVGIQTPKGDKARGMLLTDTDHKIRVVTVNKNGELKRGQKVEMQLYKLDWKWWWDKDKNDLSYYARNHTKVLQQETIETTNGEAEWKLRVNYPEWGRFLVRAVDQDGHASAKIIYIDWPGWAGRAMKESGGGSKMLTFSSDKSQYNVGENVILNIPTGFSGRALVSIESGNKVLEAHWVNATKGMTKFTFKAKPKMAPNVYAHVTLLQPHAQTKNDLPIRMYGVIPIKIHNPNTVLEPIINIPDEIQPESPASLTIREQNGKPMTYTIAIVDEGLLGLTRFQTPNAWQHFNQREALRVTTWDLFDDIVGAEGNNRNLLAIGGGSSNTKEGSKQNRFKPMVKFLGPFYLRPGQAKTHRFDVPNYVGQVRTMVIAGDKGRYGHAEKYTYVRKPLMVLGNLPRVLGPNEEITLPVSVFVMGNKGNAIDEVNVTLVTNDYLTILDEPTKKVIFNKPGEKMVYFKLRAGSKVGEAKVQINALGNRITAQYQKVMNVRPSNPSVVEFKKEVVQTQEIWSTSFKPFGMEGTNTGRIEISSVPPLNLGKRLQYLIRYPYGCVEQTTSSVFPQVYLPQLVPMNTEYKQRVATNVKAGIDRLMSFQRPSGGLSYWPNAYDENEWGTNYAGHFILEAKAAGYKVSPIFLKKWTSYQQKQAKSWGSSSKKSDQLIQAYRLYLLALNGTPELGAMNRFRLHKSTDNIALWYLSSAYYLVGQKDVALSIKKQLDTEVKAYNELGGSYGSDLRDKAIVLQSLAIMDDDAKSIEIAKQISDRLNNDNWYSTQSTAYSLVALAKYVGEEGVGSNTNFSYKLPGEGWKSVNSSKPIWEHKFDINYNSTEQFQFKNQSGKALYAKLLIEGVPETDDRKDDNNGLLIDIDYKSLDGQPIDITELSQGTDFSVLVSIKNLKNFDYEELVLDQIFPAGWEIHNHRLDATQVEGSTPEYQDIRDDRVYTFFDLKAGQTKVFEIKLNASYLGKYFLPTVYTEAMYDNTINARIGGQWIQVVDKQ